jgi:REP element-mobilizing transposase RayT
MPYIKIWIHLIWSTKNRHPFLGKQILSKVISHIRENANKKEIYLDFINGHVDHIHTLISLKADQSIAKVAHLIKGESSHWVNENHLTAMEFGWQEEYIAVSISHSAVNRVREYIKNQEEHHRKKTFAEEYQLFIEKYGFEIIGKDRG